MGFKYWIEAANVIFWFAVLIFSSCFMIGKIGSKMFNDLGNFPTKAEQIQVQAFWKVFIVEIITLVLLFVFFHVFS